MKEFFKELFDYSHYYNQQLGAVVLAHPGTVSEKAIRLYSHILNAHHIWNHRIASETPAFAVWDLQSPAECPGIDQRNYEHTLLLLDHCDLDKVISYTTSRGEPFSNSIRDILFHVINHSTYHRGQIATECKQGGLDPLVTDYIFYKR